MDFGVNYFKAESTFLVPRPKISPFYWYSIFEGVDRNVWISCALLFAAVLGAIMLCRFLFWMTFVPRNADHGNLQDVFFELLSIVLTANAITNFKIPGFTFILTIWSVFSLFIGIFYASDLVTFLSLSHFEKSINNPYDFFQSNLNWTLPYTFDLRTNINEEFIEPLAKTLYICKENQTMELISKILDGKLAIFSILRDNVPVPVSIPVEKIPSEVVYHLQVMKEHFYTGNIAPVYRKNSPYKSRMEAGLMRIVDYGIFEHIKKTEMRKQFKTLWNSLTEQRKVEQSAKTLSIDQIYGSIIILLIGYGISSIIFIIEIFIPKTLKFKPKPTPRVAMNRPKKKYNKIKQ